MERTYRAVNALVGRIFDGRFEVALAGLAPILCAGMQVLVSAALMVAGPCVVLALIVRASGVAAAWSVVSGSHHK